MKTNTLILALALTLFASQSFAQDILQSQVPSLIVNDFQQAFPKALDVEWEMDGAHYKVEFEVGLAGVDHEIWYDQSGKVMRHKEEISKGDLSKAVLSKIKTNYSGYRLEDVKKITEGANSVYTLEAKTLMEEWKLAFDTAGNELSKVAD
ncbi:PepSY-like domain-containing protein [Algoriphagus sp. H41]|uniref:PepSY-like domain-containing protein n=1 Tax=Algoriphagus oliviformis TaxID=2811231 RepID=A0ABS3C985_9BACT|nr:PepSY-like domain-containing protein [Algoriphagus oliviformis]MBN7813116.1 PepSY-like domain-containing protein [Algoriphagus oliviformis]